jgi:hypothetical protein
MPLRSSGLRWLDQWTSAMSPDADTYIYANNDEAQLSLCCARSASMMTFCSHAEAVETVETVEATEAAEDAGAADCQSEDADL